MKQKGAVCWLGPALLFFAFRFENLISSPKSYRDFREMDPWSDKCMQAICKRILQLKRRCHHGGAFVSGANSTVFNLTGSVCVCGGEGEGGEGEGDLSYFKNL